MARRSRLAAGRAAIPSRAPKRVRSPNFHRSGGLDNYIVEREFPFLGLGHRWKRLLVAPSKRPGGAPPVPSLWFPMRR